MEGLSGCTLWFQRAPVTDTSYASSDVRGSVEEVVSYMHYLATIQESAQRDSECQRLLKLHEQRGDVRVKIRLALSLLVSQHCVDNDSKRALALLDEAIENLDNSSLGGLLLYQRELALQLYRKDRQQGLLNSKISEWKKRSRQNQKKLQTCEQDLKKTQMKLEALKTIEKSLNHTEVQ